MAARSVERVELGDAAALAERLEQEQLPLVIGGGLREWPALDTWTPERLAQRLGAIEIEYKLSSSNVHPDFRQRTLERMFARQRARFDDFLALVTRGPEPDRARYLFTGDEQFLVRVRGGVRSVEPRLAPLLDDIRLPALFPEARLHTIWSWFSAGGVRTWLHYDNNGCHNLNAQVSGRKRCQLYAPEWMSALHPFPLGGDNPAYNCSAVDVDAPAPEHAVDLGTAIAHEAELEAGDLLFIPAWWFHTFEHLGSFNANVNFWWKPERPAWNPVAARQSLVDAAMNADLERRDPQVRAVLLALDRAAVERRSL